jgi:hypothetical protein
MKNSPVSFLQLVQKDCLENGVELVFHPDTEIKLSKRISVAGYWSDYDKELQVAVMNPEWLVILAHEYGHFCQWKEKKFVDKKTIDAYNMFDEWIEKEIELDDLMIEQMITLIQKCELDCEKRALKFIKKYKLYFDYELYIQKSNSYVLGYEAVKIKRKWFVVSPSRVKSVCKNMPKTFTKILKPTNKQLKLMLKKCF